MDAVGLGGLLAQAPHAVALVVVEVALEPVPAARLLVGALQARMWVATRSRNQRSCEVMTEQPGEGQQGLLEALERLGVEVIGGLISSSRLPPCLSVRARFSRLRSPPESAPGGLLLVGALEAEGARVGAGS